MFLMQTLLPLPRSSARFVPHLPSCTKRNFLLTMTHMNALSTSKGMVFC